MEKEHESDSEEQSTDETEEGSVSESASDGNVEEDSNETGVDEYGYDNADRATFEANGFDPLANAGPTRRLGGRAGRHVAGSAFRR